MEGSGVPVSYEGGVGALLATPGQRSGLWLGAGFGERSPYKGGETLNGGNRVLFGVDFGVEDVGRRFAAAGSEEIAGGHVAHFGAGADGGAAEVGWNDDVG